MIVIKKIVWDFSDTEFEDCDYEESRKIAILPKSLKVKEEDLDSDACEEDIIEYLVENYGFEISSVKLENED
tara:strand:+ start:490 stop:705 length:216 start_codon:yes stop_codon:yes gene_type:complete